MGSNKSFPMNVWEEVHRSRTCAPKSLCLRGGHSPNERRGAYDLQTSPCGKSGLAVRGVRLGTTGASRLTIGYAVKSAFGWKAHRPWKRTSILVLASKKRDAEMGTPLNGVLVRSVGCDR
jgi:hypothetical protein